jgi:hypothetical protein
MRLRYFCLLALGVAAAFLVVATQAFALVDIANLALGVGIGMFICSVGLALRFREHVPMLITGSLSALLSAWMIIASQVFSLAAVQSLTFAEALGLAALSAIGLTAHELTSERVVHSLQLYAPHGAPAEGYEGTTSRERVPA